MLFIEEPAELNARTAGKAFSPTSMVGGQVSRPLFMRAGGRGRIVVGGLNPDPRCPSSGTPRAWGMHPRCTRSRVGFTSWGWAPPPRLERDRSLAWGRPFERVRARAVSAGMRPPFHARLVLRQQVLQDGLRRQAGRERGESCDVLF